MEQFSNILSTMFTMQLPKHDPVSCDRYVLTCFVSIFLGDLALESEFDLGLNRDIKLSRGSFPERWRCLTLFVGDNNCFSNICPIGVFGAVLSVCILVKASRKVDSSIDSSIFTVGITFFPGFLTPERSDFARGLNESKKFCTFDVLGAVSLAFESPECFRCLSFFLENSPRNPVDPDLGLKSPSAKSLLGVISFTPVSIKGTANALRSCKEKSFNGQSCP